MGPLIYLAESDKRRCFCKQNRIPVITSTRSLSWHHFRRSLPHRDPCSRHRARDPGRTFWFDPDPDKRATTIHVVNALQNFTRDLFLKVFFQTNAVIDCKHLEIVFVWRYKPPFGSLQFAFQRGRADFGQMSNQGNTYFVKLTYVL